MEKKSHYVNTLLHQMEATTELCHSFMQCYFASNVKNRITFDDFIILDTLVCYSHLDANLLARTLSKEKAVINEILTKLEKQKLIKKVQTPDTKIKVKTYELTEEGDRIYKDAAVIKDELVRLLARFINESELIGFTKTLLKIKGILISLDNKDAILNN